MFYLTKINLQISFQRKLKKKFKQISRKSTLSWSRAEMAISPKKKVAGGGERGQNIQVFVR